MPYYALGPLRLFTFGRFDDRIPRSSPLVIGQCGKIRKSPGTCEMLAAVDRNRLPSQIFAGVGQQEHDEALQFSHLTEPPHRYGVRAGGARLGVGYRVELFPGTLRGEG